MTTPVAFVLFIIAIGLIFDFANGWHDAANSIATVVSTRVLTPAIAVVWAAFFLLRGGVRLRDRRRAHHRQGADRHLHRRPRGDRGGSGGRDRVGPDHLVGRVAHLVVTRADRRLRRGGGGQGRLRGDPPRRLDQAPRVHRGGAADGAGARPRSHGGAVVGAAALAAAPRGSRVSLAAARLRGALLARARHQRRPEDHGYHRRALVCGAGVLRRVPDPGD